MMIKIKDFILAVTLFVLLCGCGSSIDSDAKDAAKLMRKSLDLSTEYKLEKASEYFQQYKEIENKYLNTDKHKEFTEAFWTYFISDTPELKQKDN